MTGDTPFTLLGVRAATPRRRLRARRHARRGRSRCPHDVPPDGARRRLRRRSVANGGAVKRAAGELEPDAVLDPRDVEHERLAVDLHRGVAHVRREVVGAQNPDRAPMPWWPEARAMVAAIGGRRRRRTRASSTAACSCGSGSSAARSSSARASHYETRPSVNVARELRRRYPVTAFSRFTRPNPNCGSRPAGPRSSTDVASFERHAAGPPDTRAAMSAATPATCGTDIEVPDAAR